MDALYTQLEQRNASQVTPFLHLIETQKQFFLRISTLEEDKNTLRSQCESLRGGENNPLRSHQKEMEAAKLKILELQQELTLKYKSQNVKMSGELKTMVSMQEAERDLKACTAEKESLIAQVERLLIEKTSWQTQQVEMQDGMGRLVEEVQRGRDIVVATEKALMDKNLEMQKMREEYELLRETYIADKTKWMQLLDCTTPSLPPPPSSPTSYTVLENQIPKSQRCIQAHATEINRTRFNAPGSRVCTASSDGSIRLWDTTTGTLLSDFKGAAQQALFDVNMTENGEYILGACSDRTCRLWQTSTGRLKHTLTGHGGKVWTTELMERNAPIVLSGSSDRCIKVWDIMKGYCLQTWNSRSSCYSLTSSSPAIASGHQDGEIRLWDMHQKGTLITTLSGLHEKQPVTCVQYTKDENYLFSNGKDHKIQMVDTRTWKSVLTFSHEEYHVASSRTRIAISPDGRTILAGGSSGQVFLWNTIDGTLVTALSSEHQGAILCAAWNGHRIATADKHGSLVLWKV